MKKENRTGLIDKIKYTLENKFSNSPISLIRIIAILTFIIVFVITALIFILHATNERSFGYIFWDTLSYSINAWFPSSSDFENNTIRIILTSICSIFGLFITSLLIGLISSSLEQKLDELKRGNSLILEKNHIVLLGFKIGEYTLLKEIIKNINKRKQTILVVSDEDKIDVIDSINDNIEIPRNIKVVCRKFDMCDVESLKKCSINSCKSIIISPVNDMKTIKSIFCLSKIIENGSDVVTVASIRNEHYRLPDNFLDKKGIFILAISNFISRIISQTSCQPGLALLYLDLFNYKGSEFYVNTPKEIVGKTFKELLLHLDGGVPIAIVNSVGCIINPDDNYKIKMNDKLISYSEEEDSLAIINDIHTTSDIILKDINEEHKNIKILILGFNEDIDELIDYLYKDNCEIYLCSNNNKLDDDIKSKIFKDYSNQYKTNNYSDLNFILKDIDRVVILNDHNKNSDEADLDVMLLLTWLRDIKKKNKGKFSFVVELRSATNRSLIHKNDYSDSIVRTNIISMFLTQLSFKPELYPIFSELLSPEGYELKLISSQDFLSEGEYTTLQLRNICNSINYIFMGTLLKNGNNYLTNFNPRLEQKIQINSNVCLAVIGRNVY